MLANPYESPNVAPDSSPGTSSAVSAKLPLKRLSFWLGIGLVVVGLLPWLGLGGYSFVIPYWNTPLPRLELFDSEGLYDLIVVPLHILGSVPGLDSIIFFDGEGVVTVRPFIASLFYQFLGTASLLMSSLRVRRRPQSGNSPLAAKPADSRE
jgi:hypothetical protein